MPDGTVDARANYEGGDYAGIDSAITAGYFDGARRAHHLALAAEHQPGRRLRRHRQPPVHRLPRLLAVGGARRAAALRRSDGVEDAGRARARARHPHHRRRGAQPRAPGAPVLADAPERRLVQPAVDQRPAVRVRHRAGQRLRRLGLDAEQRLSRPPAEADLLVRALHARPRLRELGRADDDGRRRRLLGAGGRRRRLPRRRGQTLPHGRDGAPALEAP